MDKYKECRGCGREGVVYTNHFPDDYPKDMMMCCACTSSYYWYLVISCPPSQDGYFCTEKFCKLWWDSFGTSIEKVMTLKEAIIIG